MPNPLPEPNFNFLVNWGGDTIGFTEVTGLTMINEVIQYRDGTSKDPGVQKMPGLRKYENITLKRGVYQNNFNLYNWMNSIVNNLADRRVVIITLLDEAKNPVMVWKINNAWPCRLSYSQMEAGITGIMTEEIEIVHEGWTVAGTGS